MCIWAQMFFFYQPSPALKWCQHIKQRRKVINSAAVQEYYFLLWHAKVFQYKIDCYSESSFIRTVKMTDEPKNNLYSGLEEELCEASQEEN